MIKSYFLRKLYSIRQLAEEDRLSLAIVFSEDKLAIYQRYSALLGGKSDLLKQVFQRYADEEKYMYGKLMTYYKTEYGDRLSNVLSRYPWKFLDRILFRYMRLKFSKTTSADVDLEKTLERLYTIEGKAAEIYGISLKQISNVNVRKLFSELCSNAHKRKDSIYKLSIDDNLTGVRTQEAKEKDKQRLLTLIQPGLAGLMDGSVSTLGPIFAAAFATNNPRETFLVGLSASIGAGISMGFTEAIHDDGKVSGRGSPLKRGLANGLMTVLGGLWHTLPYLIDDFKLATIIAIAVVFCELWIIVWIQNKFMKISFWRATIQVVLGGLLVFAVGVLIGKA